MNHGVWSFDDLELDLIKHRDGAWRLDDKDEFDHDVALGLISPGEQRSALECVSELESRLDRYDEVFDGLGWARLAEKANQGFAPIVDLS